MCGRGERGSAKSWPGKGGSGSDSGRSEQGTWAVRRAGGRAVLRVGGGREAEPRGRRRGRGREGACGARPGGGAPGPGSDKSLLAGSEGGSEGGAGDLETKEETKGRGGWEGLSVVGVGEGR